MICFENDYDDCTQIKKLKEILDQVDFNLWVQDSFIGIYSSFRIIYKSVMKGKRLL